jgi:hypothetical protein
MTRRVLAVSLTSLGVSVWLSSGALVAQAPPADPWTLVPPFPTTCFRSEDFSAPADEATSALNAAIERQSTINANIEKEYHEMDMGEMAQRMQAFMLKDPQRAMEMMQAMNATSASVTDKVQQAQAVAPRLEQELKDHAAKFQAAVNSARNPIQAQIDKLVETKNVSASGLSIEFATAADEAQYLGLMNRLNADYEKICTIWWGANGPFQSWLRNFKTHMIENVITPADQIDAVKAVQFAILETPSAGYRSTEAMEGVRE